VLLQLSHDGRVGEIERPRRGRHRVAVDELRRRRRVRAHAAAEDAVLKRRDAIGVQLRVKREVEDSVAVALEVSSSDDRAAERSAEDAVVERRLQLRVRRVGRHLSLSEHAVAPRRQRTGTPVRGDLSGIEGGSGHGPTSF
jgi:hypothetical protein